MSDDQEFERVLSNPENIIVSDSLKDKLSLNFDPEPYSGITINFSTDEFLVSGVFKNYKLSLKEKEQYFVSFICEEKNIPNFLNLKSDKKFKIDLFGVTAKGLIKGISVDSIGPEIKVNISFVKYI
jgi:hypothetical protein